MLSNACFTAALSRIGERRFHALYDKVARSDVLWTAWGEVRANRGAPGVDGITIEDVVRSGVRDFLEGLAEPLRAGTYRPKPLRRAYIPKPGKPARPVPRWRAPGVSGSQRSRP